MPETLRPTYRGFIRTSRDACLLLEAVFMGRIQHIPRRPHERERSSIVTSGNIFIYEESASGVKRWTDGVNWSPSRILGNFLIYRETIPGFPGDGAKKTALKRHRPSNGSKPTGISKGRSPSRGYNLSHAVSGAHNDNGDSQEPDQETRELYGSLLESYPFKEGGLVKKTLTVTIEGVPHHIVSYYSAEDVKSGRLLSPSTDPFFQSIDPRDSIKRAPQFKTPVEQQDCAINEASAAYITPDQARAHQLYDNVPGYHQRALSMPGLGMPDHGLPSGPIMTMSPYGQPAFNYQPQQQLPAHTMPSMASGIQGLAQNSLDALGSGHFQQHGPHGLHLEAQAPSYLPTNFGAHFRQYPSSYTPASQDSAYAVPPVAAYPMAHNAYRSQSVAGTSDGYRPMLTAADGQLALDFGLGGQQAAVDSHAALSIDPNIRQEPAAGAQVGYRHMSLDSGLPLPIFPDREVKQAPDLDEDAEEEDDDWPPVQGYHNDAQGQYKFDDPSQSWS